MELYFWDYVSLIMVGIGSIGIWWTYRQEKREQEENEPIHLLGMVTDHIQQK